MPPSVPRKRQRASSPSASEPASKRTTPAKPTKRDAKPTIFDALDAPKTSTATPEENKAFLNSLVDSDSSLSDVSSDEFEDVPTAKKRKLDAPATEGKEEDGQDYTDDEEMDWEDAIIDTVPPQTIAGAADDKIEDLSIALQDDGTGAAIAFQEAKAKDKKGPTKRERQIRIRSHCLHVQALVFHNAVRNAWLNDKELEKILLDGLSDGIKKEVRRWKQDMGMEVEPEEEPPRRKGGKAAKGKKSSKSAGKEKEKRDGRDWGIDADRLEKGAVNMSRGDPLLRLLKILTAYWRKRFTVTAPGLRKQGYMPLRRLAAEVRVWEKNKGNQDHGERIDNLQALRDLARKMEGSRDVGAQLFTALLRGLGLETRMVANLQPVGFGWNKNEDALPKKASKSTAAEAIEISDDESSPDVQVTPSKPTGKSRKPPTPAKAMAPEKPRRRSSRGAKDVPISLDDEADGSLSSALSDAESLIDVTPSNPTKARKKYDRDLSNPHYWTEVLSPVSNTYIPVDAIALSTVASTSDLLSTFEPRGKRADAAKQVICYTIAHAPDGSAKDVTVRYLKRHQLPGRTKGYRMPVEKIPVYNKRGKVKKYEEYDWFRTVMSGYERRGGKRSEAERKEDETDLKPFRPANEKPKMETESLQWYKQSAEFVLERHLRREEAIVPHAQPVKMFMAGKGEKAKEEPVFRREDVVTCKTVESWHKEGREIKIGEQPMKMVPVRAVTLNRKREMEDVHRETGEKMLQGLYARDQTDWIIPTPIRDGHIPRNAYGNMDVYVPTMVPKGAVHIPLRGTARICRKLDIEYAEACTGFEFGKQRAVPVITGVVVAIENEDAVIDAWEIEEVEKKRKEDTKKQALVLSLWRKFVMGLRIVERMKTEYKDNGGEEVNPFVNRAKLRQREREGFDMDETKPDDGMGDEDEYMGGGGFFLPGHDEEEVPNPKPGQAGGADGEGDMGGGFLIDGASDEEPSKTDPEPQAPFRPMSLQELHANSTQYMSDPGADESDAEDDEAPVPSRRPRAKAASRSGIKQKQSRGTRAPPVKNPTKASAKRKPDPPSDEEGDVSEPALDDSDSELSDISLVSDSKHEERSSPQVVVTPKKARARLSASAKKEAPVRSPYFSHDDAAEEMFEISDSDSVQEVVKPRKTTARTRARG
ncbi:hypothetical protein M8818_003710 [Zalaria obscura]|uniref:Uncharacterized protein n=1 Tax=Zalaria obscura TaxID=2024903 RepID=A0ACC3SES5_9PEZI